MTGALFLRLNERFALGADDLQWILYRASRHDPDMTNSHHWHGVSFVRSTKDILLRCMRENGCKPSDEAQATLDAMPPAFAAWKAAMPCRKAVLEPVARGEKESQSRPASPRQDGKQAVATASRALVNS
jgi:hypothetical protein